MYSANIVIYAHLLYNVKSLVREEAAMAERTKNELVGVIEKALAPIRATISPAEDEAWQQAIYEYASGEVDGGLRRNDDYPDDVGC